MTTHLLDGDVLTALCLAGHVHHERVRGWFGHACKDRASFATCSVTQGTLLRMHMRFASDPSAAAAWQTLGALAAHSRHVYWSRDVPYTAVPHRHLQGPKQVTDAWLAELARAEGGVLTTLDAALAALHADVATIVPV